MTHFKKYKNGIVIPLILVLLLVPAVMAAGGDSGASTERAIRFSIPSSYYTGETVLAEGITDLPVGTSLYGTVTGDSGFIYKVTKEYVVYEEGSDGWNKWKMYVDTSNWNPGDYVLTVYEPVSGVEKSDTFKLVDPETSSGEQGSGSSYGSEDAAIRMALENTYYEGETIYATGITTFPVGTYFDAYVKSQDSDFDYTSDEGAFVYQESGITSGWNDWKLYIQPDGWDFGTYELTVTEPVTGVSNTRTFTIKEVPSAEGTTSQYTYENQRAIRFALNKQYCINQTIEIDGITDLPAGEQMTLQVEGINVNFKWTSPDPVIVQAGSDYESWNSFKATLNSGDIGEGEFTLQLTNAKSGAEKSVEFEVTTQCEGIQTLSQQQLIEELQKENEDLKKENEMLKKIIEFFSSLFG